MGAVGNLEGEGEMGRMRRMRGMRGSVNRNFYIKA
jgi:hypothetical protein